MIIEIGSTTTLVPVNEGDEVVFESLEGQQVLHLRVPDEASAQEILMDVVAAVGWHMSADPQGNHRPAWIECTNAGVLDLLCKHYGLTKKQTTRPKGWGQPEEAKS